MGTSCDPPSSCGTGWGGVWTAKDDFVAQRRRTRWFRPASKPVRAVPPRLYVDNKTIIREVTDLRDLQPGDHCLITINLVRCVSPFVDYVISSLGSMELCYLYHHFIIMDNVSYVDEQGVPRTASGELAEIMEYGNTVPEALKEVRVTSSGSWLRAPIVLASFLLNRKSKCHRMALADYGDTPHIYKVVESLTPEERERIVQEAERVVQHPFSYHILFNNCEHVSNFVSRGCLTSPLVRFMMWNIFRMLLCCIGLLFLHGFASSCYSSLCISYPLSALVAYYIFTCVPVFMQASVSFMLVARSIWRQYGQALISHDDYCHLLGKELGRMVVVGGGASFAISAVPAIASRTQYFATACGTCAFAYIVTDLLYNLFAHVVMRGLLLPLWGRVWLLGAPPAQGSAHRKAD